MKQNLLEQTAADSITACKAYAQHPSVVEYPIASSMPASARSSHTCTRKEISMTARIDEILEHYDPFIHALARKHIHAAYAWVCSELLEDKVNELTQRSRIKFWHMLQQHTIKNPRAYIRCIVCTELIDTLRLQKKVGPLSLTEEGELYHDYARLLVERSEGMNDPAFEAEEHETAELYLSSIVAEASKLPPRQQKAMFCLLKDKLGDFQPLREICNKWNIDIDAIAWPEGEDEQHKLKACVAPAKKKIRAQLSK